VCFCWIFFKANDLETALTFINQIAFQFTLEGADVFFENYKYPIIMIGIGFLIHLIPDDFADRFNIAPPPKEVIPPVQDTKLFQGSIAFDSVNTLTHDLQASKIFDEFREELQKWWQDNKALRQNEDSRGNQADFLTDKYMCGKLDPLPPSNVPSRFRDVGNWYAYPIFVELPRLYESPTEPPKDLARLLSYLNPFV
jgi:hypothetical protein